jgi:hypothetical protein
MAFDLIKRVTDLIAPDEGSGLPDPFFFNDCAIRASARLERGDTTLLGFMTATRPEPTRDAWRVSHRYLSLLRLEQIAQPQTMLANEAHVLVDLHRQVLAALWEAQIRPITIVANDPSQHGVIFCVGAIGIGASDEEARAKAERSVGVIRAGWQGMYRQVRFAPLGPEATAWLMHRLMTWKSIALIKGLPRARREASPSLTAQLGMPNEESVMAEQIEIALRELSRKEFILEFMGYPLGRAEILSMLRKAARQLELVVPDVDVTRSHTAAISLPFVYAGGAGGSQAVGHGMGVSASHGVSQSVGHSLSESHTIGQSETVGQSSSVSHGVGETASLGATRGAGISQSASSGWSAGRSVSEGHSLAIGHSVSHGVTTGQSIGTSTSRSEQAGVSASHSLGASSSVGASNAVSHSYSESHSTGSNWSFGRSSGTSSSVNDGGTTTNGVSGSLSKGTSGSMSFGGQSSASLDGKLSADPLGIGGTAGGSVSGGNSGSLSTGVSHGLSHGYSASGGSSAGVTGGASTGTSFSDGGSASSSQSYGLTGTHTLSASSGTSATNTTGVSDSAGASTGLSRGASIGTSSTTGESATQTLSQSVGASAGRSGSVGAGLSDSVGSSATNGVSASTSYGATTSSSVSSSASSGVTHGVTDTTGTSAQEGQSASSNDTLGASWSNNGSLAIAPMVGVSVTKTYPDEMKRALAQILTTNCNRMVLAQQEGAYCHFGYLLTPDSEDTAIAAGAVKSAWWGPSEKGDLPVPLRVVHLDDPEIARHMTLHAQTATPCFVEEPSSAALEDLWASSVLTLTEMGMLHRPPRIDFPGIQGILEPIPPFRVRVDVSPSTSRFRRIYLGKQVFGETGDITDFDFALDPEQTGHTLVSGASGGGKTVTAEQLVVSWVTQEPTDVLVYEPDLHEERRQHGALVLDWKDSWRGLKAYVSEDRFRFASLWNPRFGFKFNLLEIPDGFTPTLHRDLVANAFGLALGVGLRGRNILVDAIDHLYQKEMPLSWIGRGDGLGCARDYPELSRFVGMADLHEVLKTMLNAKSGANKTDGIEVLLGRLQSWAAGQDLAKIWTRDIVEDEMAHNPQLRERFERGEFARRCVSLSDLLRPGEVVVLEGGPLDPTQKKLVITTLIGEVFTWARLRGKDAFAPPLMVVLEEAHQVVVGAESGSAQIGNEGETLWEQLWNEGRSYGIRMMAICQLPEVLPESVVANSHTLIAHRAQTADGSEMITRAIGKDPKTDHRPYARFIARIPIGWAIVRERGDGTYGSSEPVLVHPTMLTHAAVRDADLLPFAVGGAR